MARSFFDDALAEWNNVQPTPPDTTNILDPAIIVQKAMAHGLNAEDAEQLATAALDQIQSLAASQPGPLSREQAIYSVRSRIRGDTAKPNDRTPGNKGIQGAAVHCDLLLGMIEEEIEKALPPEESLPNVALQETSFDGRQTLQYKFNEPALSKYFDGKDPYSSLTSQMANICIGEGIQPGRDIITKLCASIELAVELGKQLRPGDILNLYIASKAFRSAINGYMLSSIRIWIADRCPEAGRIFPFKLYKTHLVPDPDGRTWGDIYKTGHPATPPMSPERLEKIRTVPGLRYMQLVLGRDRYCREIAAIMARSGHLMPRSMHDTLLRLWLLMDMGYTEHRRAMLRNPKLWRDEDLYNAQLLFVKLGMHFNDPVYGPSSYELLHLILGQRGLYPLWQLLTRRRWTTLGELVEAKVRYDFELTPEHWRDYTPSGGKLHGVPLTQVGTGHREGWGASTRARRHLMRPDELIPIEAVTRGLQLGDHIRHMILWGYFNWETGENIVPTEEDMYISDEEATLAHMDTRHHWRKKHSRKKRWDKLTPAQQQAIREDDEDEHLRALAWCGNGSDDDGEEEEECKLWADNDSTYSLNDEIKRGFIVPAQAPDHKSTVPAVDDGDGWADFVNSALIGAVPELGEDEKLRMQALDPSLSDENFDWIGWMKEEGFDVAEWENEGVDENMGGT